MGARALARQSRVGRRGGRPRRGRGLRPVGKALGVAGALALAGGAAGAGLPKPVPPRSRPGVATPGEAFAVTFVATGRTGVVGAVRRRHVLTATSDVPAPGGTAYFVVRARDGAGHEDAKPPRKHRGRPLSQPGDRYRYMNQRAVAPQAQSLCFAVHRRQLQCSHQIHLRWFTSSTKSATIQRRISVRDTPTRYRRRRTSDMGRST